MRYLPEIINPRLRPLLTMALGATLLGACSDEAATPPAALPTLSGEAPLIIGHRGLPGLFPEETRPSYEGAADAEADSLEVDLHLSKDCVLVARHNAWLSDNTNIAEVAMTNPDVAARKRTVPGVMVKVAWAATADSGPGSYLSDLTDPSDPRSILESLIVDGEDHTNDWSISDFTVAELKQWFGGTTYDARDQRPTDQNGKHPVLTFQEVIDIAVAKSKATGRSISIYPETKNPVWNNAQAIANGCGPAGSRPFEAALLKVLSDNELNTKDAAVYVQSFDPASLKHLRSIGLQTRVVQLIDGNAIDYKTGDLIYKTDDEYTFVDGRPYSWTLDGDPRYFGAMLTPEGSLKSRPTPTASGRGSSWSCRTRSRRGRRRTPMALLYRRARRREFDRAEQRDRRRARGWAVRPRVHLSQRGEVSRRPLQG